MCKLMLIGKMRSAPRELAGQGVDIPSCPPQFGWRLVSGGPGWRQNGGQAAPQTSSAEELRRTSSLPRPLSCNLVGPKKELQVRSEQDVCSAAASCSQLCQRIGLEQVVPPTCATSRIPQASYCLYR